MVFGRTTQSRSSSYSIFDPVLVQAYSVDSVLSLRLTLSLCLCRYRCEVLVYLFAITARIRQILDLDVEVSHNCFRLMSPAYFLVFSFVAFFEVLIVLLILMWLLMLS